MNTLVQPCQRRGAVLVAILGLLFAASIVVALFVETQLFKLRQQAADYRSNELRTAAYSALETTLAVLGEFLQNDNALYAPAQGWADPLAYAGFPVREDVELSVRLTDLTGKLSLPQLDEAALTRLFETLDIDLYDAQELAQCLLDWQDEDDLQRLNGAEKDRYDREDPPCEPPNRPLASYNELRYVSGFHDYFFDSLTAEPNERFEALKAMTTLRKTKQFNLNTTTEIILEALAGEIPYTATRWLAQIAGPDNTYNTDDDTYLKDLPNDIDLPGLGTQVELLRIEIFAQRGSSTFLLEALAHPAGNTQGYPFTLKMIRENAPIE